MLLYNGSDPFSFGNPAPSPLVPCTSSWIMCPRVKARKEGGREKGRKRGRGEYRLYLTELLLSSPLKIHWTFLMNAVVLAPLTSKGTSVGSRHSLSQRILDHRQVQLGSHVTSWHMIWAQTKKSIWILTKVRHQKAEHPKLLDIEDFSPSPVPGYGSYYLLKWCSLLKSTCLTS